MTTLTAPRTTASGTGRSGQVFAKARPALLLLVSLVIGLAVWSIAAAAYGPTLIASPATTARAAAELWEAGTLQASIAISMQRIAIGWALGVVVGAPLGIFMGRIKLLRQLLDPYIEFFRFVPPIAFVTLAIVWFGPYEVSKVVLIFYTSVFIVTINTIAGVVQIPDQRFRAAQSLGASRTRILLEVVLPSSVPHIVTSARLALGNSFLTIVSAEIVAADNGLGALIWQARNYSRIDWIFVGIVALGLLGFCSDRLVRLLSRWFLSRFGVRH